jgi:hypothetical protein
MTSAVLYVQGPLPVNCYEEINLLLEIVFLSPCFARYVMLRLVEVLNIYIHSPFLRLLTIA